MPVLWTRWSLLNWRMKRFVPMLHQGSQWARLEDMESRFVWCFCNGDWSEHMKLCTFISYSVLLSWPGFSCEKSPKQTVKPVSWSWFFSTGNWGLFCEGNWRLLLQCYGIPCTQVHYHVIYNLVENHCMLCSHSDLTEASSWVELSREA